MRVRSFATAAFFLVLCTAGSGFAAIPDWLQSISSQPLPEYSADTPGVVLLDDVMITVGSGGEMRETRRRAMRILGTAGRDLGIVAVAFDNETKLLAFRGWTLAANGQKYELKEKDAVEVSAYDFELYSDSRAKVLRLPHAEPGSIVAYEVEQRIRPIGFQIRERLQASIPVRKHRLTLQLPAGWTASERWLNQPAVTPQRNGNAVTYEVTDIPPLEPETRMPSVAAVASAVLIDLRSGDSKLASLRQSTWQEIGQWYAGLVRDRRTLTPEIGAKANALLATAKTPLEKVMALARFAQREVRYVAIEIGIGGYQPHRAADIFRSQYGDCKDKVTILGSLLSAAGVDSYYVLVNTDRGAVARDYPSVSSFNHVIAAIPAPDGGENLPATITHPALGKLLLFDPTSTTTPFGQLPDYLQGNSALLVREGAGDLIDLPVHAPTSTQLNVNAQLILADDGSLSGELREVRTGWIAAGFRQHLMSLTETERTRFLQERLGETFSNFVLQEYTIDNLSTIDRELVVRYRIQAPRYARSAGDLLLVRPRVGRSKAEARIDVAKRRHPYLLDAPSRETEKVEIRLPDTLAIDELPAAQKASMNGLSYSSQFRAANGVLTYERVLESSTLRVPVESLGELNTFFSRVAADEKSTAVLKRAN